jgi:hypothetical protein
MLLPGRLPEPFKVVSERLEERTFSPRNKEPKDRDGKKRIAGIQHISPVVVYHVSISKIVIWPSISLCFIFHILCKIMIFLHS